MSIGWLVLVIGLAFFLAWNLGANDVANAMGTSVGSKVITLRQAILLAGILEFAGAVLFGQDVTATLTGKIADVQFFDGQPRLFVLSVVAELLTISLWLLGATWRGWPVASSHAAVGAIAGVSLLLFGVGALDWIVLRRIAFGWLLTPVVSGLISAGFFTLLQRGILARPQPVERWLHWQPWLSVAVLALMGGLVLPTVVNPLIPVVEQYWHWHLPKHDYVLGVGFLGAISLMHWTSPQLIGSATGDRHRVEQQLGKFQLLSACCMAFGHGSNDVGNAVAPLASFNIFWQTQTVSSTIEFVPLWILGLGGLGIVTGLATWGQKVIVTVGEQLVTLTPSYGFCAELGAATTILLASRWGLPMSTTHALIGSVVGIGLVQGTQTTGALQWSTIRQILVAWVLTIPVSMGMAASILGVLRFLF